MRFGIILMRLRKKKGWSQDGLSRELGLSPCPLRQWEKGERLPTEDHFLRILKVLGRNEALVEAYYTARNSENRSGTRTFRTQQGESFGSRMRQLMTERELSANSLAGYLKVTTNMVRTWLRDQRLPLATNFDKLFELLGKDLVLVDLYISTQKFQRSWAILRNNQKKQKRCPGPRSAFCDMLRNERLKLHLSQADIGHELGISHSAVSLWEAAGVLPDPPKFERLADILNLSREIRDKYAELKKKRFTGGRNE